MNCPGKLIVFEGGEGCGKTTQLLRTKQWIDQSAKLKQLEAIGLSALVITREPGGTPLCGQIRQLLLDPTEELMDPRTELLLYAADRAQHVEQWLKPALSQGMLVLCDRYTDSTVAYQGYGRGLDLGLINQLNEIATQRLKPDLTLWLDLDVEIGLSRANARGKKDRIEQADLAFHKAVRRGFEELAVENPHRIKRIDAGGSIDAVSTAIQAALETAFSEWNQSGTYGHQNIQTIPDERFSRKNAPLKVS
jgi:dTMP kinase